MVEMKHKILGTVGSPREQEKSEQPMMTNDDLKSLIELGCVRDTIEIGDKSFTLRSLNAAEKLDLSSSAIPAEDEINLFALNAKMLATSIETVNGKPFETFHEGHTEGADIIQLKMDIITRLQTPVIGKLLEFFQNISERCEAQFTVDQVKN